MKEFDTRGRSIEDSTIDPANVELLRIAKKDGIDTAFDRVQKQEPKCTFCEEGVSCRTCNMGPCRITPNSPRGVCGATADTMVARGLLQNTIGGAASHMDHARHVAILLREAGMGNAPYKIKDEAKLRRVAGGLGIDGADTKDKKLLATEVANRALEDLGRQHGEDAMDWIKLHAPEERIDTWKKLGILPFGGNVVVNEGMHRRTMGVDADPVNIILGMLKTGIVDGYGGLAMSTDLQDILFGSPSPKISEAGLGVLREDYINISTHGHVPLLSEKIVDAAEELEEEAIKAGAKGINVVGLCCTGIELLERKGIPIAGNELNTETAIITGAMEAVVVDYQCIYPGLVPVADNFHTKVITTADIAKIPGAEHIDFNEKEADKVAKKIVRLAIDNFKNRDPKRVNIPNVKSKVMAGFTPEVLVAVLSKINKEDPLKPLVDAITEGKIRGAVAIVGCNNPRVKHDFMNVGIARELIKRNVLVISTGCVATAHAKSGLMNPDTAYKEAGEDLQGVLKVLGKAAGMEALPPVLNFGSCVDNSRIGDLLKALSDRIGVPIKDLPVLASAPEYTTEKALSIGTWAVSLGVTTHINPPPRISGSQLVTKILTEDAEGLVGATVFTGSDPVETARVMIEKIEEKRRKLGLN